MWIKHKDTALNTEIVVDSAIDKAGTKFISTVKFTDIRILEAVPVAELFDMVKGVILKEWGAELPLDELRSELRNRYVFSETLMEDFIEEHGEELALKTDERA